MFLAAFTLALSPQSQVAEQATWAHAGLHPQSANYYLELPDLRAAFAAYDAAPLIRLWKDPATQASLEAMLPGGVSLEWEWSDLEEMLLSSLGQDWPLSMRPLEVVGALSAISMSAAIPVSLMGPSFAEDPELPEGMSVQFVVEFTNSDVPAQLLRVAAEAAAEASGRPLGDDWLARGSWSIAEFLAEDGEGAEHFWVALDGPRLVVGGGVPDRTLASAQAPADHSLAAYQARAAGTGATSMLQTEPFSVGAKLLGPPPGEVLLRVWSGMSLMDTFDQLLESDEVRAGLEESGLPIAELVPALRPLLVGFFHTFLGLTGPSVLELTLSEGGFVTRQAALEPLPEGEEPSAFLSPSAAALAPADASFLFSRPLDGAGTGAALRGFLAGVLGDQGELWQSLESAAGMNLEQELFALLGPEMLVYGEPLRGLAPPGALVAIAVKDEAKVADALRKLLPALVEMSGGELTQRERPYLRMPYFELGVPALASGDLPIGSDFAFGVADGRLVIGLPLGQAPVVVKRELRRIQEEIKARENGAAPASPLVAMAGQNSRAYSLLYLDWRGVIASLYSSARTLGGLAGDAAELPIPVDLEALPPPELFLRHLLPTVSTIHREGEYLVRITRSPFGPELSLLVGAGVAAFVMQRSASEDLMGWEDWEPDSEAAAGAEPSEDSADTRVETTRRALQRVRSGIGVWSVFQDGRLPEDLETLTRPTADLPGGVFNGGPVPVDGWGRSLRYTLEGGTYRLWSVGANGTDEGGGGDDVTLE